MFQAKTWRKTVGDLDFVLTGSSSVDQKAHAPTRALTRSQWGKTHPDVALSTADCKIPIHQ